MRTDALLLLVGSYTRKMAWVDGKVAHEQRSPSRWKERKETCCV